MQAPMISSPLKQTNEIDWIAPLKAYIRQTYGDDPEKYAEECATLNRLRQDMRGAGKDSAAGRDLLYRYYGQLELLDLRFPVDENHIKVSFTWYAMPVDFSDLRLTSSGPQVRRFHAQTHLAVLSRIRESFDHLQHFGCALVPCGASEPLRRDRT